MQKPGFILQRVWQAPEIVQAFRYDLEQLTFSDPAQERKKKKYPSKLKR